MATTAAAQPARGRHIQANADEEVRDLVIASYVEQKSTGPYVAAGPGVRIAIEKAGITQTSDLTDEGVRRYELAVKEALPNATESTSCRVAPSVAGYLRPRRRARSPESIAAL